MRKVYLLLGVMGLTAMGGTFAACSSDDSAAGDDTKVDSGQADTYVPVTDSGPKTDSGPGVDSGPCVKCKELISGEGSVSNACKDSLTLALAAIACVCNHGATGSAGEGRCDVDSGTTSADGGAGACGTFCANSTGSLPDNTCIGCGATQCTSEFTACEEDTSEPPPDAGTDAGDGGDGG